MPFDLADFRLSRERQERIDRYLSIPVWGLLTLPGRWDMEKGSVTVASREDLRRVGMSPLQIVEGVRDGMVELVP